MAQVRDERSLGDLFSDLSRETTTLVRQEDHPWYASRTHKKQYYKKQKNNMLLWLRLYVISASLSPLPSS